jgi:hypothetical protein
MGVDIVRHGLEAFQQLLRLVNDALVAQHRAVVGDVDRSGFAGVLAVQPLRFRVALPEGLEGTDSLCKASGQRVQRRLQ